MNSHTALAALLLGLISCNRTSAERAAAGLEGNLASANPSGRTGAYFVPSPYEFRELPVLVAIHGTGGTGKGMVELLRPEAQRRGFIVVAPDSGLTPSGVATWQVGDKPVDISDDYRHILAAVGEVRRLPNVQIDARRVLIAGHSGGGSTAPYLASNEWVFTHFAILHGGVFPGGVGPHHVPGWISTGAADPMRTPSAQVGHVDSLKKLGFEVVAHVYPGGHGIGEQEEKELLDWWLGETR